jgi:hypothetical protein
MTTQHPITPPPDLVQQWAYMLEQHTDTEVFTAAARWGADIEIEACVDAIYKHEGEPLCGGTAEWLHTFRRPKPPSLKEQALSLVEQHKDGWHPSPKDWDTIRRALEALPND